MQELDELLDCTPSSSEPELFMLLAMQLTPNEKDIKIMNISWPAGKLKPSLNGTLVIKSSGDHDFRLQDIYPQAQTSPSSRLIPKLIEIKHFG